MAYNLDKALYTINIAEDLSDELLKDIGVSLKEWVDNDDLSRQAWLADQDDWLRMSSQIRENKSYPWEKASNVKYPLMTVAALQFQSRAMPALVDKSGPVKAKAVGRDPQGFKTARAARVSKYMSYQVMEKMEEWIDDMDRMLFILPIIGMAYKKTYFSENLGRNRSILVMAKDLIVNYHAQDYTRARLSHVIYMDSNELKEFQNKGIFRDVELNDDIVKFSGIRDEIIGLTEPSDNREDVPYEIVESHCWWDLDEDGYKEPYTITYHRESGTILRISARWEENGIEYREDGNIARITPVEFFTPYIFLPDPESAVYGIGFGRLLGPTNEAVNTLINQLVDGGTLSNMQSGFITRGVGLRSGNIRFRPGEWKVVNTVGDDLRKGIVPMPVREPSNVLFQLLGFLVSAGQQISSVSDIMLGENPGQNQPATTTMAVLEQGLKVFSGIYARLHRQLGKEFQKIYKLNSQYLDIQDYLEFLDEPEDPNKPPPGIEDFEMDSKDIIPSSDPSIVSDAQKLIRSQALLEKMSMGLPLNGQEVMMRMLEAEGHEDIEALLTLPPPKPSPEELEFQLETIKTQIDAFRAYHDAIQKIATAEAAEQGSQLNQYRAVVDDNIKVFNLEQVTRQGQQKNAAEQNSTGQSSETV